MTICKKLNSGQNPLIYLCEMIAFAVIALNLDFSEPIANTAILEYAQITLLALCVGICFYTSQKGSIPQVAQQCYLILGLGLIIVIARELNFGRAFYCEEGVQLTAEMKSYYKSLLPIRLAHGGATCIGIFIVAYALKCRLYRSIFPTLQKATIYLMDLCCIALCLGTAIISERAFHHEPIEECAELLLYIILVNICWKYSSNKNKVWGEPETSNSPQN